MGAYGRQRDFNDHRDRLYAARTVSPTLPLKMDLNDWEGPAFDQGNYGSCTGHAGAGVARLIYKKYFGLDYAPSRAYIYDKERILEGTFPSDNGAQMRTICKVLTKFGFALEDIWPYTDQNLNLYPTPPIDAAADKHHDLLGYHRVTSSADVVSILGDPVPWPVLIGFTVYQSFESQQVAETGIMPVPGPHEMVMGGHAVYAKGYDIQRNMVLCRNSWGQNWGLQDDFWMPMDTLDRIDTDLWIIHLGHPWKTNGGSNAS